MRLLSGHLVAVWVKAEKKQRQRFHISKPLLAYVCFSCHSGPSVLSRHFPMKARIYQLLT